MNKPNRTGARPKPYTLSFRLRSAKHTLSTYQEVYMLLRIGEDRKLSVITGYRIEREVWYAYNNQPRRSRNNVHSEAIESRLNVIRHQIDQIYRYQAKKSQIEGWLMSSRTVLRQFQGLPAFEPVKPITPCRFQWKIIPGILSTKKNPFSHAQVSAYY